MTRKSRVEYNAIAWVSEIQLCVRSVVLSFMARPSLGWWVTWALNVPHQYGQVLGVDLNRSELVQEKPPDARVVRWSA